MISEVRAAAYRSRIVPPSSRLDGDHERRAARGSLALPLLVVPLLVFIFTWSLVSPTDPDYWWHVRTGDFILDTGTLPRTDLFSYTAVGHRWTTHEWLTQVLLSFGQRTFGYVANVIIFGLASAATGLLVYATCRLRGVGELGAALLMLGAFLLGAQSVSVRPQLLTTLLLALTVFILTYTRGSGSRLVWVLPPVCALWVNLHGGYVVGLMVLTLSVLGAAVEMARGGPSAPVKRLGAVLGLAGLATLMNPHGVEAWLYPFTYAGAGNASMRYLAEWQSPSFHDTAYLLLAATLLLGLGLGLGRRPLGVTDLLWGILFTLMALRSVRHIALYGVVLMPLLGARLQHEVAALRRTLSTWRRPALLALMWPVVALGCLLLVVRGVQDGPGLQLGREPSSRGYPAEAITYLRSHAPAGNMFNEYAWGGYLIYHLYPDRQVFIDGRADVYGDALMDTYAAVAEVTRDWSLTLDRYDVQVVVVPRHSPLARALASHPEWMLGHEGSVEQVHVRRKAPFVG